MKIKKDCINHYKNKNRTMRKERQIKKALLVPQGYLPLLVSQQQQSKETANQPD